MSLDKEADPLRHIPTKHPTDLRAEIGPILRAARLKSGQSLEVVAQKTRISKRFLEALEENRFEQFPAAVYMRGFLQNYCEHLDVNFEEMWKLLNASAEAPAQAAGSEAPGEAASPVAANPAPAAHAAPAHAPTHGAMGAIALAVILAIALAVYLSSATNKPAAQPAQTAPAALLPMPRQVEPLLVIRLNNDTWLRVSVDGQIVFEGRAPKDAVQEWKPSKFVDLRTTEPAALEVTLNGQPVTLSTPGPDGQYRVEIP